MLVVYLDYMVLLYGNAVRVRNRLDSDSENQAALSCALRSDLDSQNPSLILQITFKPYLTRSLLSRMDPGAPPPGGGHWHHQSSLNLAIGRPDRRGFA